MNDNIVSFPGTEDTPAAILRNALQEADKMDAVLIFSVTPDGEVDLSASGMRISDLCMAATRLQGHAIASVQALEDMADDSV